MTRRHAIDLALDLARMPALGRVPVAPPLPPNIIDVMRIAAASPEECHDAAVSTGEPPEVLIEAARFYLQQQLFRADADAYRVLGIQQGTSRAVARDHMRLLLQWLHPDRNGGLEAVYAERVVNAWREVSASSDPGESLDVSAHMREPARSAVGSLRLPWIKLPLPGRRSAASRFYRGLAMWFIPAGAVIIFLALWSAAHYLNSDQTGAMIRMP
jgi:hypothetical protein